MLIIFKRCDYKQLENGIKLFIHKKDIAPFSWMKFIVISETDMNENGREIIIHEVAHIRHRHSLDLLVVDVCIILQWFNPAVWLIKQELQNIHEYQADEAVIKEGVNAKQYQLLLIKKAVGKRLYSMANSFNHSKLKKRITMMSKQKSSPWARWKYLYILPVVAVSITAFARPEVSNELSGLSNVKVNDLSAILETNKADSRVKSEASLMEKLQDDGKDKKPPKDSIESKEKISYRILTSNTPEAKTIQIYSFKKEGKDTNVSITIKKATDGKGYKANGEIKDAKGKPLSGKTIKIDGIEVTSDSEGKISFDVSDPDKIQVVERDGKKFIFSKSKVDIE